MDNKQGYIRARIKTQEQIARVYPPAVYWRKPVDDMCCCGRADEVVLPYLGKIVWVKKKRRGILDFYYEIKDTDGVIVMPNWIAYFESDNLVHPAEGEDNVDYIWLMFKEDRIFFIDDLLIITG